VIEKWGLSLPRAYSLMGSAEVADALEDAGITPAVTESALRELSPVLKRDGAQAAVDAYQAVAAPQQGGKGLRRRKCARGYSTAASWIGRREMRSTSCSGGSFRSRRSCRV
jgi:hypothetical protein